MPWQNGHHFVDKMTKTHFIEWKASVCYHNIMMTSSNGNIFRVTGHLCREFTGYWWIPRHKVQWPGALMFSLICVWINGWVNNREAGDLRRHLAHYDVTVIMMFRTYVQWLAVTTQYGLRMEPPQPWAPNCPWYSRYTLKLTRKSQMPFCATGLPPVIREPPPGLLGSILYPVQPLVLTEKVY